MQSISDESSKECVTWPLCVDLDGTLLRTDTLLELTVRLVGRQPWKIVALLIALTRGKASLKYFLAQEIILDVSCLPYRMEFIDYLKLQAERGRTLLLTTGANNKIAQAIADHLGLFDKTIASDEHTNCVGSKKADLIRQYLAGQPFVYAGNSAADLPVWRSASAAIVVAAPARCQTLLRAEGIPLEAVFGESPLTLNVLLRASRCQQWAKNILVFTPLLLRHGDFSRVTMGSALLGFCAFSTCASAIYLVNDLLDLDNDRRHRLKRNRPLASGALPLAGAVLLLLLYFGFTIGLAVFFTPAAQMTLALYALLTCAYSYGLKRMLFIDVMLLALFYTIRMLFGGLVTDIAISHWTLAFSMFLFLSLALVKRIIELRAAFLQNQEEIHGRGYLASDISQVSILAGASGYSAVLVLSLYINSPEVALQYSKPQVLWGICAVLVYWLSRLIILANRGLLNDDPVLFALRDRPSLVAALIIGVIGIAAAYL